MQYLLDRISGCTEFAYYSSPSVDSKVQESRNFFDSSVWNSARHMAEILKIYWWHEQAYNEQTTTTSNGAKKMELF